MVSMLCNLAFLFLSERYAKGSVLCSKYAGTGDPVVCSTHAGTWLLSQEIGQAKTFLSSFLERPACAVQHL